MKTSLTGDEIVEVIESCLATAKHVAAQVERVRPTCLAIDDSTVQALQSLLDAICDVPCQRMDATDTA